MTNRLKRSLNEQPDSLNAAVYKKMYLMLSVIALMKSNAPLTIRQNTDLSQLKLLCQNTRQAVGVAMRTNNTTTGD